MFWALGHFSKFVRRGATRIDSQSAAAELQHCPFQNPDGSLVGVITNSGREREWIHLGNKMAAGTLSGNSITTLARSVTTPSVKAGSQRR
jgi:glucosylceramidase